MQSYKSTPNHCFLPRSIWIAYTLLLSSSCSRELQDSRDWRWYNAGPLLAQCTLTYKLGTSLAYIQLVRTLSKHTHTHIHSGHMRMMMLLVFFCLLILPMNYIPYGLQVHYQLINIHLPITRPTSGELINFTNEGWGEEKNAPIWKLPLSVPNPTHNAWIDWRILFRTMNKKSDGTFPNWLSMLLWLNVRKQVASWQQFDRGTKC